MGNDNSKALSPKTPADLKGAAYAEAFTNEQVQAWCKNQASRCNGGLTSKDALKAAYGEVFPQGDQAGFAENSSAMFGADNGMINIRALAASCAVAVRSNAAEIDKILMAFQIFDTESGDLLTKPEVKELINAISKVIGVGNAIDENIDKVFATMDSDRDGKINQQQFKTGCMSNVDLKAIFTA